MAADIIATWGEEQDVIALALLNGALFFAADLLRYLPSNYLLASIHASSYGMAQQSSGNVTLMSSLPQVEGKRVLILDDVLDTGLTLTELRRILYDRGAAEVKCAVAVDKKICRVHPIEADFVGFEAGPDFLIGYGMDDADRYRNLDAIAIIKE